MTAMPCCAGLASGNSALAQALTPHRDLWNNRLSDTLTQNERRCAMPASISASPPASVPASVPASIPAFRRRLARVLLTNDDGIDAPGLAVLEAVAAELADEVWVVAPEHDQSGTSHSISLHSPLRVSPHGDRRFGVLGTPGDCVVMAVRHLMKEAPTLVLSGINRGGNLGVETMFSGTVGAAMTGLLLGLPSIAMSQTFSDRDNVRWDTARALAPGVIRSLLAINHDAPTCLNVNFPDVDAAAAGPLTASRQ